jgi:transcriptional regulator with XRE-family HTH domain
MIDMKSIREFTRRAIEQSGLSRYQISQDTGIDEASLSLFVHGKRGFRLERIEALLDYLGYEIRITRKGKAR